MGPGTDCDDQNECVLRENLCADNNAKCLNTIGSYDCVCKIGYATGNDPTDLCADINECQEVSLKNIFKTRRINQLKVGNIFLHQNFCIFYINFFYTKNVTPKQ